MRFHTDKITEDNIFEAARKVGISVEECGEHGSRTHNRAFEIKLSGSSNHNSANNEYRAATFDEWGVFLEILFRIDPTMRAGNTYFDYHHFVWSFNDRYGLMLDRPEEVKAHKQHRWGFDGFSMGNTYSVQSCKCGAITRRVTVRNSIGEKPVDAWHRLTNLV